MFDVAAFVRSPRTICRATRKKSRSSRMMSLVIGQGSGKNILLKRLAWRRRLCKGVRLHAWSHLNDAGVWVVTYLWRNVSSQI